MKPNKTILGILLVTMAIIGCKKDDDNIFEKIQEVEEITNELPSSAEPTLPENNSELVSLLPQLEWEAAIDPEGKEVTYDIYLGTGENTLTLQSGNSNATTFQQETELQTGTTYFWKIIAKDDKGFSESEVFTFSTAHAKITQMTDNAPFSKRRFSTTTAFNNKLWVIGGENEDGNVLADVWSSSDGTNWNLETDAAPFGPRKGHTVAIFNNKMWIYSGSDGTYLNNQIWSSTDGINWVKEENDSTFNTLPFYGQSSTTMFAFEDKIWRLAAYDGSIGDLTTERNVWNSEDGKNWTLVKENHGFDQKYGMSVVEFNGKLYGLEGNTLGDEKFTKVWESTDGINWTLSQENLPFSYGFYNETLVHDDKLFVTAGSGYSELWFTADGINWQKAVQERLYPTRYAGSSVILDNKILVVGGGTHSASYNDIWVIE